jgi:hypothetical protein
LKPRKISPVFISIFYILLFSSYAAILWQQINRIVSSLVHDERIGVVLSKKVASEPSQYRSRARTFCF